MGLVVETGDGIPEANSYVSLAEAEQYFDLQNRSFWSEMSDREHEAALTMATQYLDGRYQFSYVGMKASDVQGLHWPRIGARDPNGYKLTGVPQAVKTATMETAAASVSGDLFVDENTGERVQSFSAGAFSVTFTGGAPSRRIQAVESAISAVLHRSTRLLRS